MNVKRLLTIICCLSVQQIFAGGFQINEHNARAMGMGGAFTAVADDPSAVYFNPAGITQLAGLNASLGTTLIAPIYSFRGVSPDITEYEGARQVFFPVHLYSSFKLRHLAVGLGFTSPFGLASNWDEDWVGKYLAIKTDLQTFNITPTVAYSFFGKVSLSAALNYGFANVTISQKSPQTPFAGDAFMTLTANDNAAVGYTLAALITPIKMVSLGISYRSSMKYHFEGSVSTTGASQLAAELPNGDASADLTTPYNLQAGIAVRVIPRVLLSVDGQYVGWDCYDSLKVSFSSPEEVRSIPRMYWSTYILRFGTEVGLSDNLKARAGLSYDKCPVDPMYLSPSLPESNRLGFSAGLGYTLMKRIHIDAAYSFIRGEQLTVTNSQVNYAGGITPFNGTYNTAAHLASLTVSYY